MKRSLDRSNTYSRKLEVGMGEGMKIPEKNLGVENRLPGKGVGVRKKKKKMTLKAVPQRN